MKSTFRIRINECEIWICVCRTNLEKESRKYKKLITVEFLAMGAIIYT